MKTESQVTPWQIPPDVQKMDIDVLKIALTQSEARLKGLEASISNINSRVQNLLTLYIGIVVASIGFYFSHQSEGWQILLPTLVTIIYSLSLCWYLLENAYSGQYRSEGSAPSSLFPEAIRKPNVDIVRSMYSSLLFSHDIIIKSNFKENERRWAAIEKANKWGVVMPIALMATYFFVQILQGLVL